MSSPLGSLFKGPRRVTLMSDGVWVSSSWVVAADFLNAAEIGESSETVNPDWLLPVMQNAQRLVHADSYEITQGEQQEIPEDAVL